jgi:hypothetical protein
MAVKYTPGPWKFREYAQTDEMLAEARSLGLEPTRYINNDGSVPVSAAETGICTVSCQTPFKRGSGHRAECDERDANARLIAAAPCLLEALQGVLWMAEEWFKHGGDETTFSDSYKESLDEARAVILKATGEA